MPGPNRKIDPISRGGIMKIEHAENGGWVVDRRRSDADYMLGSTTAFSNATDLLAWLKAVFDDNPKKDG